jgi:hypothetical protein
MVRRRMREASQPSARTEAADVGQLHDDRVPHQDGRDQGRIGLVEWVIERPCRRRPGKGSPWHGWRPRLDSHWKRGNCRGFVEIVAKFNGSNLYANRSSSEAGS